MTEDIQAFQKLKPDFPPFLFHHISRIKMQSSKFDAYNPYQCYMDRSKCKSIRVGHLTPSKNKVISMVAPKHTTLVPQAWYFELEIPCFRGNQALRQCIVYQTSLQNILLI